MLYDFFFLLLQENSGMGMKRERNFEVLRTMAMFFIVVYHCLTHGIGAGYGFSATNPISLSNLLFSDFMLVFSSIAVNLYVMISGYFLVDLDFKLSRIVRTWTNACFYSFVITVIFMALQIIPLNVLSIGKSLFPISSDAYWFVTQYIGLLVISPFLAMMVRQLTYRQYLILLIGGAILCLAIIPDFPLGKRFYVAHGNSIWSFAYLFIVAGFIKHHLKEIPVARLLTLTVLVTLVVFACEIGAGYQSGDIHLSWLDYNGLPFVLSVVVFLLVRQYRVPENGFWSLLVKMAPYTFGVYLIHDHLLVRDWLWSSTSLTSYCEGLAYPLIIIGLCLVIFIAATLIDTIRKKLFALLKVDDLIARVDKVSFYS